MRYVAANNQRSKKRVHVTADPAVQLFERYWASVTSQLDVGDDLFFKHFFLQLIRQRETKFEED